MRFGLPPLLLTTKIAHLPPTSESNTMRSPSGDQRGVPENASSEVNCTVFEPSLSHTQISLFPSRLERPDEKAILLPSGEKSGSCSVRVEVIKGAALGAGARGPPSTSGTSTRQMLLSPSSRVYARWRP